MLYAKKWQRKFWSSHCNEVKIQVKDKKVNKSVSVVDLRREHLLQAKVKKGEIHLKVEKADRNEKKKLHLVLWCGLLRKRNWL